MRLKSKQPKRPYFSSIYNDVVLDEIKRNVRGKVVNNKPPMMGGRKQSDIPYNGPLVVPPNSGTGGGTTGGGTTGGGTTGGGNDNFTGVIGPSVPSTNTYTPITSKRVCPDEETIDYLKDLNGPIVQLINEERLKNNTSLLYTNEYLILAGINHLKYIFANDETLSTHTIYLNHGYHDLSEHVSNAQYTGATTLERLDDNLNNDDTLNQDLVQEFVIRVDRNPGEPIPDFNEHLNVLFENNIEYWRYLTRDSMINRIGVSSHFEYVDDLDLDVYLVDIIVHISSSNDIEVPSMPSPYPQLGTCSFVFESDVNPGLEVMDLPYNATKQGLREPLCLYTNKYKDLYSQFNPYFVDAINELRIKNQLTTLKFDNRLVSASTSYGDYLQENSEYYTNTLPVDEKYNTLRNGSVNIIEDNIHLDFPTYNALYLTESGETEYITFNSIANNFIPNFNGGYVNLLYKKLSKDQAVIADTYGIPNESFKIISEWSTVSELNDIFYNNFYERLINDSTIRSVGFAYSSFIQNNVEYVVHHYSYSRNPYLDVAGPSNPEVCVEINKSNVKFTTDRAMNFSAYCDSISTKDSEYFFEQFDIVLSYINTLRNYIGNNSITWSNTAWNVTNEYIKGFLKLGEPEFRLIKPNTNDNMFLQRDVMAYTGDFNLPTNTNWFIDTSINNPITVEKVFSSMITGSQFTNLQIINYRNRPGEVETTYADDLQSQPMDFLKYIFDNENQTLSIFHKLIGNPKINAIGYSHSLIPNYYYANNTPDNPEPGGSGGTGTTGDGIGPNIAVQNVFVNSLCFGTLDLDDTPDPSNSICYPQVPLYQSQTVFPRNCSQPTPRSHPHVNDVFSQSLELINIARAGRNLTPLTWSPDLAFLADLTNKYVLEFSVDPNYKEFELISTVTRTSDRTLVNPVYLGDVDPNPSNTYLQTTEARASFYGIIFETALPNYDVEFPIYYRNQGVGFNPNQYIVDILSGRASGNRDLLFSSEIKHIGINYMYDQTEGEPDHVMFNLVVSPNITSQPQLRAFHNECGNQGSAPPQDPSYANPLTKPCPVWPVVPEWPIVCPTPYTYEAMQAIAAPIIAEINGYRTYRNLQPLVWNKNLTWAAQIYSTYKHYDPLGAPAYLTPNSSHGTNLAERVAASNFNGTAVFEAEGNIAGVGGTNPLNIWCMFKSGYTGETTENGLATPFTRADMINVQNLNAIGIGFTRKMDDPVPGSINTAIYVVYGTMVTDNSVNTPPLEDELITCVPEEPPSFYADPLTAPCPVYDHPDWPIVCPTAYTYELMEAVSAPVVAEMNAYRTYRGMQPMVWNKNLTWAAQIVATYWYNNAPVVGNVHETPGSPHGTTLQQRLASANWVGGAYAEGASGDDNYDYPTNPKKPNIMNAFCLWKSSYAGNDVDDSGHFNPYVRSSDVAVQSYNSVGIGWIRNFDSNNDSFLRMIVVYGNTTTDTQAQAPPLEDEYITCIPPVDPAYANPITKPCPAWSNVPEYPIICPTPYTYEAMEAIAAPVIAEMNGYRAYRGMQPMVWNKNLTWAAQIIATYNHYHPGAGHDNPLGPYGPGLNQRIAASNFIGEGWAEGLGNQAGNGGEANPLRIWCNFRGEYQGEGMDNGHFNPFTIPQPEQEAQVRAYNAVGIGWTRKVDDPAPGWINVGVYFVYGHMITDNSANAPPLEDPLILCTVSI